MKKKNERKIDQLTQSEKSTNNYLDFLEENERVLYEYRPNKRAYAYSNTGTIMTIGVIWLICIVFIMVISFALSGVFKTMPLFVYPLFFGTLALFAFPFWVALDSYRKLLKQPNNTVYLITDRRILYITGINLYVKESISLKEYNNMVVTQSFADKIFKVSDIYITSSGGDMHLFDLENVDEVCEKIKECVKKAKGN